jgi:hypothetical protein
VAWLSFHHPNNISEVLMYKVILCGLLLCGCGLPFTIGQDIPEQSVPGDPNPLPNPAPTVLPNFLQIPLTINLQSEIERRKTGPARSVVLRSLTLAATPSNNPSGNFDFLDEVHIYVESDSQPQLEIATLNPVPRGSTSVSFTVVPDVELLPYIKEGTRVTSRATGRFPPQEFTFNGHLRVTIYI